MLYIMYTENYWLCPSYKHYNGLEKDVRTRQHVCKLDKPRSLPSVFQLQSGHEEKFLSGWQVSHHPFFYTEQLLHMPLKH